MSASIASQPPLDSRRKRQTLATCGGAHFIHDGLSDALYVFLPLWADAYALSHAQVGLLKTAYVSVMSVLQLPAGMLAERIGARALLGIGTLLAGLSVLLFATAQNWLALVMLVALAGAAASTQHPLASSLVTAAWRGDRLRSALGTYNFAGDLGKVAIPLALSTIAALVGWRMGSVAIGAAGILAGVVVWIVLQRLNLGAAANTVQTHDPATPVPTSGWGIQRPFAFSVLSLIAILDSAVRVGLLTFLPFLLLDKGAELGHVGFALTLVFAGGAAGKLLCGLLSERLGIVRTVIATELLTALCIVSLLYSPLTVALWLLPLTGLALNGTSSVLYGTVPEFVSDDRQARGFGLFYTLSTGAGAVSPLLNGLVSDRFGLAAALTGLIVLVLATVPLTMVLRAHLHREL